MNSKLLRLLYSWCLCHSWSHPLPTVWFCLSWFIFMIFRSLQAELFLLLHWKNSTNLLKYTSLPFLLKQILRENGAQLLLNAWKNPRKKFTVKKITLASMSCLFYGYNPLSHVHLSPHVLASANIYICHLNPEQVKGNILEETHTFLVFLFLCPTPSQLTQHLLASLLIFLLSV